VARIRIAWRSGEVIADLRESPTVTKVLAALPCKANANRKIAGDPGKLKSVRDGDEIRVETV